MVAAMMAGILAIAAQPEEQWIIEDLHHEVLPVNVYPSPEIGEARCQAVEMVGRDDVETEQVQHSGYQVEVTGYAQIEQKVADQKLCERIGVDNIRRSDCHIIVDDPIKDQMDDPANYPVDTGLVDAVLIRVVVGSPEALVVHDRKHRKADVRQHEKVTDAASKRRLLVPYVIEIDDKPEHEHGG